MVVKYFKTVEALNASNTMIILEALSIRAAHRGGGGGGATGAFSPGPSPKAPGGPPEYLFKRSIYSNRAVTVFFRGAVQQAL